MTPYMDWKFGATYSFSSLQTTLLPSRYDLILLTAVGSYQAARRISGEDLYAMWRGIYPSLPPGTPDNPETATWLVFESQTGETIVLANDWINGDTVTATNFTQATVLVTDTNQDKMMVLRDFMTKLRMKFEIKFN